MPLSNTNNGATFPGLTLKAWAQVSSAGALIKGFNVASYAKGATGNYTATFTAALATTSYMVKVQPNDTTHGGLRGASAVGTSTYVVLTIPASTPADVGHYVEWWE